MLQEAMGDLRRFMAPSPKVLKFLIIGLMVRLLLAPFTSYPYDAYPFYGAVVGTLAGTGPYGNVLFTYPPLFSVIYYPLFWVVSHFVDPSSFGILMPSMIEVSRATGMMVPFITSPVFNIVLKLPIIIGDALVGLTLYRIVEARKGAAAAEKAFLVWFLNPLVIFVSSVHGQFDVLAAYFALIGVMGFMDKRYLLSGAFLGLGVLLKLFPAYLVISFGLILLVSLFNAAKAGRSGEALKSIAAFISGGALSLLSVLPFLLSSNSFLDYVLRRGTYSSIGGMNAWFIMPFLGAIDGEGGGSGEGIPVGLVLLIIGVALTVLVTLLIIWKVPGKDRPLYSALAVITVVMVTQSVTNPQHLIWLFPLMVVFSSFDGRMTNKLYVLSVIGLLYLLCLQSGLVFFYPLAHFTGWPSVMTINQGIETFFIGTGLERAMVLSVLGGLGFGVLLSVLLPYKWDIMERLMRRLPRRVADEG
ncbi:MAG TPA: hypothetical protein PKJ15_01905 [Methanomassiliicoccales archaeon]|nr:hypothetical protein [Methanomassiliicoccales archaeon]